jgi:hypothetical protein
MNDMKRSYFILSLAFVAFMYGCTSLSKNAESDITVLPLGGGVKVTEGSIVYALPLTVFEFDIAAEKMIEVPGPYAAYAGEMIGLDNVIKEENEIWTLTDISMRSVEELDPEQFYVIQGTTLMQSNLLKLKESGLVLDINPDIYLGSGQSHIGESSEYNGLLFPDRGANEYVLTRMDTAYRIVKADTAFIRVPYLVQMKKGMTVAQEAREAADRLLELREGRHMILTGETNVFPQDGAAIDEINRLEREYTALFAGKTWSEIRHFRIWFVPDPDMAGEKSVLFYFSETDGVKTSGQEGTPVHIELVPSGKTRELNLVVQPATSQKELAVSDRLYYRVPDVARISITSGDEILYTARKLVYQFGNTVVLPSNFIIGR